MNDTLELLKQLPQGTFPGQRKFLRELQQSLIDDLPKAEFDGFDNDPAAFSGNALLNFYDSICDRLLTDVPAITLRPGEVAVWYIYNHGWLIKTAGSCFGIDIHHRRAAELEPLLDFIAVTHNHGDHYNLELLKAMNRAGKTVISNFFPNLGYTKASEYTHTIRDITIHCGEADHNPQLRRFVMPLEIVCSGGKEDFVFFTSGDCFSSDFLKSRTGKVNLYCIHPLCNMKPVDAAKKLSPEMTFVVHLQELGHEIGRFRWTAADGDAAAAALNQAGFAAYVPVWGEKFIWDGSRLLNINRIMD